MHENPYEGKNPNEVTFAGDNFMRTTGDSQNFYEMQHFSWEACHDKPDIPNIFAEPSQAAVLFESYKEKKRGLENEAKSKLTEQYGGDQHTKVPPKMLLTGQTEVYQEYAPDGSLVRGNETIPKSKYEEDIHPQSHSSVWGSFYDTGEGKWGYKCCKQLERQSVCMKTAVSSVPEDAVAILKARKGKESESGKKEKKKSEDSDSDSDSESSEDEQSEEDKKKKKKHSKSKKSKSKRKSSKKSTHKRKSSKKSHDRKRHVETPEKEEQGPDSAITKKRKYHSVSEDKVPTTKEMESYKRQQVRWDDPMRNLDQ